MRDPLSERDYAAIRAAVMTEVRRRGRRRPTGAWAIGLVPAAIVLAILLVPRKQSGGGQAILPVQPKAIVAESLKPAEARQARLPVLHKHKRHHKEVVQTASAAVTRIDIQTADPDVRIIWLARQEDSK